MEKIQDFFKHVGERLRNPFIFSYLISWLIANYKIVVGLCFYSIEELQLDGYNSYLDLISDELVWWRSILIPLIGASVYTFGFPYFRRYIVLKYTEINKGQEEKTLDILKDGYISTDKYLRLRESYKDSQSKLVEVISDESKFLKQRNDLNEQISNLRKDVSSLQIDKEKLQNYVKDLESFKAPRNIDFLEGIWEGLTQKVNDRSYSFIFNFDLRNKVVYLDFDNKTYALPIRALMTFEITVYFEFREILAKRPSVPTTNTGIYASLPRLEPTEGVDIFHHKLGLDGSGYYIFKMVSDREIRCFSTLKDDFTLHKTT